jgi:hypothetical protein
MWITIYESVFDFYVTWGLADDHGIGVTDSFRMAFID